MPRKLRFAITIVGTGGNTQPAVVVEDVDGLNLTIGQRISCALSSRTRGSGHADTVVGVHHQKHHGRRVDTIMRCGSARGAAFALRLRTAVVPAAIAGTAGDALAVRQLRSAARASPGRRTACCASIARACGPARCPRRGETGAARRRAMRRSPGRRWCSATPSRSRTNGGRSRSTKSPRAASPGARCRGRSARPPQPPQHLSAARRVPPRRRSRSRRPSRRRRHRDSRCRSRARPSSKRATRFKTGGDVGRAYRTLQRAYRFAFPSGPIGLRRTILLNLANASFYLGRLDEAIDAPRAAPCAAARKTDRRSMPRPWRSTCSTPTSRRASSGRPRPHASG